MGSNSQFAERFFAAATIGDLAALRAVCAPNLVSRQNSGPESSFEAIAGLVGAVQARLQDFRYENPIRVDTTDGFVEEHEVCATLPDGAKFRAWVCVVGKVEGGLISSLHEYFDSAEAAPLLAALTA